MRKAFYVKRVKCLRVNENSGPFLLDTQRTVIVGPFFREVFADRAAVDCMGHPQTVPGTTEIIEREVA